MGRCRRQDLRGLFHTDPEIDIFWREKKAVPQGRILTPAAGLSEPTRVEQRNSTQPELQPTFCKG
jgi:hypothetical protein